MQNVGLATSRQGYINVSFRDFPTRRAIAVNPHGAQMHEVSVDFSINNGAAEIVTSTNIIVNSVAFGLAGLHRVRRRSLLRKVHYRIRLFLLNQFHQQIVLFGDIQIDELDFFPGDFFPCLAANLDYKMNAA